MQMVPLFFTYLGVLVFLLAVLFRIFHWVKMPMHLRWELYPVAHEGKRARYGGSYLEESEWWAKPRTFSLWGELKVMVPEILFLVALREHNRPMWLRSFPFHFGLYLVASATFLMGANALFVAAGGADLADTTLFIAVTFLGTAGLILGIIGAIGLLQRRLTSSELKDYTSPGDIFNLVFFVGAFGISIIALAISGTSFFAELNRFILQAVTLQFSQFQISLWTGLSVILMGTLLAYIPLTHMSHFVGKYFAYHAVRWNDKPNLPGSRTEESIKKLLIQPVSWAGPHIRAGGKKNWIDLVANGAEEEEQQ